MEKGRESGGCIRAEAGDTLGIRKSAGVYCKAGSFYVSGGKGIFDSRVVVLLLLLLLLLEPGARHTPRLGAGERTT